MTCKLSVNVNAIAYLRNRRNLSWPSVTGLSRIALEAGAYGITVHPRPDERHIRRTDVFDLAKLVRGEFAGREYNIEGNPDARFVEIVETVRPDQVTLVPDDVRQATSDHGWDIGAHTSYLSDVIGRLKSAGLRVSVFIDPDPNVPGMAAEVGADRVEIYTGLYGAAPDAASQKRALAAVVETGRAAEAAGIGLNAGHDLTLANLPALVAALPNLQEVSIGHAITADALVHGMTEAVRLYRAACADPVEPVG
ncbi:MAG: pyridoxine 5'-phosphate synthase [Hyphomicrobiales bacterium]